MATTSTSIPVPARRTEGRKTWIGLALVAALLAGGAAAGIQISRGGPEPAVGPVDTRAYENTSVTGTGPGLLQAAGASAATKAYQGITQSAPYAGAVAGRSGVVERGSMVPRHHSLSAGRQSTGATPPAGDGPCLIVAGRPIC
jgi:hypothetical protein